VGGEKHGISQVPCKTCPYRRDVPSGIWAAEEYEKLRAYDGEIIDQMMRGGRGLFLCHQKDGNLCAGWLACHRAGNLLALRLRGGDVDDRAWGYATTVPVFSSGAEAAEHGLRDLKAPGAQARRAIDRLASSIAQGPDRD